MSVLASRILGLVAATIIVVLGLAQHASLRGEISELRSTLAGAGAFASDPELAAELARATEPVAARLLAARALLAVETDPATFVELSPSQRRTRALEGIANLRLTRLLAEDAMVERPASWQAHLLTGASTYLEALRSRSPRDANPGIDWERSLLLAHELAPSRIEPLKFLGAAYLSEWSNLDEERRHRAVEVLEKAFRDPATLEILLPQWLRVSPSLEGAMRILPESSRAWRRIGRHHADRRDWERFCLASDRADAALLEELHGQVGRAARLLRAADIGGARGALLDVVDKAPVRGPFEPVIAEFLRRYPAGAASARALPKLREWLVWSASRCLQDTCALDQDLVDRLAGLAELENPIERAEAAVLAGDLARAEIYERRSLQPNSPSWTRYLLLKSRLLAERGRRAEALETLESVALSQRSLPEYILTGRVVAETDADKLGRQRERRHISSGWTKRGTAWDLKIEGYGTGGHIEIEVPHVSGGSGPVQVLWNGYYLECRVVAGRSKLRVSPPTWRGLNELTLVPLHETRLQPGTTELIGGA